MKFEPIKIKIKDPKLFASVALAVDSPCFVKEADSIRRSIQLTNPLGKYHHQSWVIRNILEVEGKEAVGKLFRRIREIRDNLYLDASYQTVLEKAVFGCDILPADYKTTFLINLWLVSKYPEILSLENDLLDNSDLFVILLTHQTRKKDVIKLYDDYEKFRMGLNEDTLCAEDKRDYKGEIKRDRIWYWKKQEGKTYLQIAKEDKEREVSKISPTTYKETVRKGVKAYEKALSPYIF